MSVVAIKLAAKKLYEPLSVTKLHLLIQNIKKLERLLGI